MSTITTFVDKEQAVAGEKTMQWKNENTLVFSNTSAISGDVVQALDIPAGAFVTHVGVNVKTAEAGTISVGDGDNAEGWDTSVDVSATGNVVGDGAYSAGKLYIAEDTIDFTLGADFDSAIVNVFALYSLVEDYN